jgi:hypothetical protein
MRKPPTGEPCAGEPHARFGGRGGATPSRPLSWLAGRVSRRGLERSRWLTRGVSDRNRTPAQALPLRGQRPGMDPHRRRPKPAGSGSVRPAVGLWARREG